MTPSYVALLRQMFQAAVDTALPERRITALLPTAPKGKVIVIGAGKASAAMARAFEQAWQRPVSGLVVTRYGYAVPCEQIEIVEAAHPVPDEASALAARRMLAMVDGLTSDDLVFCLISGGGSALLAMPLQGLSLDEKQRINQALLKCGASISEINCVRRHLSAIKGGRLARACAPAKVFNILLSDVPGDQEMDIASGPTVPDSTTCRDALAILDRYGIELTETVRALLVSGSAESVKPGSAQLPEIETRFLATPQMALESAALIGHAAGWPVHILGDAIEGESKDVAKTLGGLVRQVIKYGQPFKAPCILLSGGETTVTVRGAGRGGRNVEFLLSLLVATSGLPGVYALAADTDGVDGQEDIAGAWIEPKTLNEAWERGLSPLAHLDQNDGHGFFQSLGCSLVTGPTMTNVNDFRAILITEESTFKHE